MIVWRFTDAQPGHDSQTLGLLAALKDSVSLDQFEFSVHELEAHFPTVLFKRFPNKKAYPAPDFLIGAGHKTHWPMLAARRRFGGRAIVLMKPSLPIAWFDAAVIPHHDGVKCSDKVFVTQGVLNAVRSTLHKQVKRGLILLGGPSLEYNWQSAPVLEQIKYLLSQRADIQWTISSSRRTPPEFVQQLSLIPNLELVQHARCETTWLINQLAVAGQVWVTEDSVSMLYEALSSGARVGVLKVARIKTGRVAAGIDALVKQQRIAAPGSFELTPIGAPVLSESARCAKWIISRWIEN